MRRIGSWVGVARRFGVRLLEDFGARFVDVVDAVSRSQTVERVSSSGVRPSWVMETLR